MASGIQVVRVTDVDEAALQLIEEYYEAVHVVLRDTQDAIRKMLDDPASALWLAYHNREAVGCVLLKPIPSIPSACECKRLYVKPSARGHGIADQLMNALETFARSVGRRFVYLDSYDKLETAIALYRRRGYSPCERYNDNPQANVFLRKDLLAVSTDP